MVRCEFKKVIKASRTLGIIFKKMENNKKSPIISLYKLWYAHIFSIVCY